MDAKAQRKALFRTKLRESAQKKDKRIDSDLVRYNEYDQPVCRVCNITLKSETNWPAHQASRKHHEAIENLRATAAARKRSEAKAEAPAELRNAHSSSMLPADFFDKQDSKRQKTDTKESSQLISSKSEEKGIAMKQAKGSIPEKNVDKENRESQPSNKSNVPGKDHVSSEAMRVKGTLPDGFFDNMERNQADGSSQNQPPSKTGVSQGKQPKGALPEGFFDNKEADLRARGIEPVKVDINDAYKEFEKDIMENLQEVDDRLEEDEIDAAEIRQEFESLEQKEYREQAEMIKQKLLEKKAAQRARGQHRPAFEKPDSSDESLSDADDADENFVVDWRAKHV